MTAEAGNLIQVVGTVAAVVGVLGSAVGTVIGTKIGVTWLEKRQDDIRKWVSDLDTQVTDHGERIAKVEGICEERRLRPRSSPGGSC
jgi:hypothetical protein